MVCLGPSCSGPRAVTGPVTTFALLSTTMVRLAIILLQLAGVLALENGLVSIQVQLFHHVLSIVYRPVRRKWVGCVTAPVPLEYEWI